MKQKLTNNLGLKILAVLFSACLWMISININDPISQDSYSISVQMLNSGALTTAGKYVEVADGSDRIRVTVRGTRSALTAFSGKDIVATADLTKMTEDNLVPIEINTNRISDKIESIKSDSQYVKVDVENISKLQIPIDVIVQNEPGLGYILGSTTTAQNVVIISGPESLVSEVEKAAVEINVDDATSDVNISLPIHLYDTDEEILDTSKITMSMSEVSTTASILQTKQLPIECGVTGSLLDGYVLTGRVDYSPAAITVAAKSNTLKNLNSISIPEAVDITGCDTTAVAQINLREYLPDGVSIVSGNSSTVDVVVYIEKASEKAMKVSPEKVHITNVPEGYTVTVADSESPLEITAIGLGATINQIDEDSLVAIVDVQDYLDANNISMAPGHMDIPVSVSLPDGVKLNKDSKVLVTIKKN